MKSLLVAGLLAATAGLVCAQEEQPLGGQPPRAPAAEAEDLFLQTLQEDIRTAGYYELLAWCRSLGLSDKGTRQTLQQRLLAHYGVGVAARAPAAGAGEEAERLVEIKSARTSEYFTIQEVGDELVVLEGDVVVELREKQAVHRIRARRVVLNQTQNLLMAEGSIEYTLVKGAEEEKFRGERLTFDVSTWEGVFFGGGMEADRPVGGKTIRFAFHGETISRLADDTVVLEQGTITSCDEPEDPHYSIRARRIWVLAPNEWAIAHALLYIGRVPVLYLPFFFHPGDEFIFHPAIGYRDREGSFIQTTTYLIGQKKRAASALSFLAAAEESGTQYSQEPRGLFLRPAAGKDPPPEGRFLKLLVDYYNRLGGFVGVDGAFPPAVNFRGGAAVSRSVYQASIYPYGYVYTPWWPGSPAGESDWNSGWLLGMEVPLRFGLSTNWVLGSGAYRLAGRFEYYSDPFFTSDFFNRSEEVGLLRFIGMEDQSSAAEGQKSSLTWELSGQADFSEAVRRSWLTKLSLSSFSTSLLWQSKEDSTLPLLPPGVKNVYDPARQFYYPSKLRAPAVAADVQGDLLNATFPGAKAVASRAGAAAFEDWQTQLRLPAAFAEEGAEPQRPVQKRGQEEPRVGDAAAGYDVGARAPEPKTNLPGVADKTPASLRVSYQLRPTVAVEEVFESAGWDEPASVDFEPGYTSVDTTGLTTLSYQLRVLENVLSLSGNLQYSLNYKTHFRQSLANDAEWDKLLLSEYGYNQMNVRTSAAVSFLPAPADPVFGRSSLSYSVGLTALKYTEDGIQDWQDSFVSQHLARGALAWVCDAHTGELSLSAELPPRAERIAGNLAFEVWLLKTVVNTVYSETGWQPLILQETLTLSETVRAAQELRFDVGGGLLTKSISSVTAGGLSGSFTAERLKPKSWDVGLETWIEGPVEEFVPSYVNLAYKLLDDDFRFWKNRIKLETSASASWSMNIQEFTQNSLDFSFSLRLFVHKFLEVAFTSVSYNNRTYLYFPGLANEIGQEAINPFVDLARSFNFFRPQDRYDSAFKLKSISVEAVHHLHDWDLSLRYDGRPILRTDREPAAYVWGNTVTILVQWAPLPEMRRSVKYDDSAVGRDALSLRG